MRERGSSPWLVGLRVIPANHDPATPVPILEGKSSGTWRPRCQRKMPGYKRRILAVSLVDQDPRSGGAARYEAGSKSLIEQEGGIARSKRPFVSEGI